YQNVIAKYAQQVQISAAARFGLAAVAEDRRDREQAAKIYTEIASSDTWAMYKDLAAERLRLLERLKTPLLVGELSSKPADLPPTLEERIANATTMPDPAQLLPHPTTRNPTQPKTT